MRNNGNVDILRSTQSDANADTGANADPDDNARAGFVSWAALGRTRRLCGSSPPLCGHPEQPRSGKLGETQSNVWQPAAAGKWAAVTA